MARTSLSIEVELVSGRGEYYWPRPGRIFVARRASTFRQLAEAINLAFGRWELAHLHRFVLADGTEIVPFQWWDEIEEDTVDDAATTLSRLQLGEQFAYEFDLGDGWEHPVHGRAGTDRPRRQASGQWALRAPVRVRRPSAGRVPLRGVKHRSGDQAMSG